MPYLEGFGDEVVISVFFGVFIQGLIILLYWKMTVRTEDEIEDTSQDNAPPVHNPNICPICWGEQRLAVETNCGHLYCGACLNTLYEQNTDAIRFGITCPMCRQQVTILFIYFTNEERSSADLFSERRSIRSFVNSYNRIFSLGERTLWDQLRNVPILFRHFIRNAFSFNEENVEDAYRIRFGIMLLLTLIYVIVPSDLLPEYVFGFIGLVDDLMLLAISIFYIATTYHHLISNRPLDNPIN